MLLKFKNSMLGILSFNMPHIVWYKFLRHRVGNNIDFTEHLVHIKFRNRQTKRYPTEKEVNNQNTCGNHTTNNCLYLEIICKQMEWTSTKRHRGGACCVIWHFMQLMVQKHQTTRKNLYPVWCNINLHMFIKIVSIAGLEKIH